MRSARKTRGRTAIRPAAVVLLCLGGCGEPGLERVPVTGTVTVAGSPLAWGEVYFKAVLPVSDTIATQAWLTVQDGAFTSTGVRGRPGPGSNSVVVRIYQGPAPVDGSQEEADVVVKGYWQGTVMVEPGTPITLDLQPSEIIKHPPG